MARFCFYPAISRQEDADDLLARAAWFFADAPVDEVTCYSDLGQALLDRFRCPVGLDDGIEERFTRLRSRLRVRPLAEQGTDNNWDAVLLWQDTEEHHKHLRDAYGNVRIWKVDKQRTRMEGSFWIEAHYALQQDRLSVIESSRAKLIRCREDFQGLSRAVLLASGPSVAAFGNFDYGDSLSIVCNTVVADTELLDHVRPRILVFADPIFHFGPSRYSMEFRRHMKEAVSRFRPWVVVPMKYYKLLCEHVPEIADRVIPLPHAHRSKFNINLMDDPELKVTANVLTYLMLPLAATFCREISLLGCDGRPLAENQYFWNFNPRTQLEPELMQNIKDVHPSFFSIDYNSYYTEHTDCLGQLVMEIEKNGKRVRSLAPSHIPVLQRRSPPPSLEALSEIINTSDKPIFLSLNPNLSGLFGHYLHFDARLREGLLEKGWSLVTLASRDLDLTSDKASWPVLPFFSMHAHHANKTTSANADYREWSLGFRAELYALFDVLEKHPHRRVRLFHYMVTPRMLHEVVMALAERPTVCAEWVMNLTGIYVQGWPLESLQRDVRYGLARFCVSQAAALASAFRLRVVTDTSELAGLLAGPECHPPVLPMFGVTHLPEQFEERELCSPPEKLTVLYPSNAQSLKGYDLLPEAMAALLENDPERFHFVVRIHSPIGREQDAMDKVERALPDAVERVGGVLGNSSYYTLLTRADIILLPYRAKAFHVRTSGQLIDAILMNKPIVATRETWAGRIVQTYGCGEAFSDGSSADMARAIRHVADNLESCCEGLARVRREWLTENTPRACVDFLVEPIPCADEVSIEERRTIAAHFQHHFDKPLTKGPPPASLLRRLTSWLQKMLRLVRPDK